MIDTFRSNIQAVSGIKIPRNIDIIRKLSIMYYKKREIGFQRKLKIWLKDFALDVERSPTMITIPTIDDLSGFWIALINGPDFYPSLPRVKLQSLLIVNLDLYIYDKNLFWVEYVEVLAHFLYFG